MVGLAVSTIGCASGSSYRARPITVQIGGDPSVRCVDRALTMSRQTGYVEQTVDKDTQFFRVVARATVDKRGRPTKSRVRNFNIACIDNNTLMVTPVGLGGVLAPETKLSELEYEELGGYARSLGVFLMPASAPPPPPATEGAATPKCLASENPEWSSVSAARKKELLDACR